MRKTYSVYFTDCRNGYHNHKLVEAECAEDVYEYMTALGHTDIKITEREV